MPVSMSKSYGEPVCFGPFELNTRTRELRRKGLKIDLHGQPVQILLMLLENPGEMVTREELSGRLWPPDTFVDAERGLNKAVNKLRAALQDDAERPSYIETLPLRGYRFIAPVQSGAPLQARPIDSLAVLPLEDLTSEEEPYFADGLTEELISALAHIASLRVISRTSVSRYKEWNLSLPEIADRLSVEAIVEGTVLRTSENVRITVHLVRARDDRQLWSGRYERPLKDILRLHAEVAQSIANQVSKVVDPDHAFPEQVRQVHPAAYEACLKGSFLRDKMMPAELEASVGCFRRALEIDSSYARAFAEMSRSFIYLGIFGMGRPGEMFGNAKASAEKALELDESLAAAHISLSTFHIFCDWDWTAAEFEAKRAVELSSGEPVAHAHFADFMSIRGRHSEAIDQYGRVLDLDPISRVYLGHFGLILHRAGRYEESIAQCSRALALDPYYGNALWFQALSLEQLGRLGEAIEQLHKAVTSSPAPHYKALLARMLALAGERQQARTILAELTALYEQRYVSPFDLAVVHSSLGELDAAFQWLDLAYAQRVFRLIELTFPMFQSLRSDLRWQCLVRNIGLPL